MFRFLPALATGTFLCLSSVICAAGPFASPGDTLLRHDLQLLDDAGAINIPLTAWPLAWGDIDNALAAVDVATLNEQEQLALRRLRRRADFATDAVTDVTLSAAAASNPRTIRTFEDTPRENGEVTASLDWTGDRFAANLSASYAINAADGDEFRPDDTYVGVALGNWMLSAGWQQRWWGPGRDGSLILSSNARPVPAISLQRNRSDAFESRWLRWIGPWSVTTFMGLLDDEREIDDALLFGVRVTFRPIQSLEIGLSRTAQWCGEDRLCDVSAFADLLLGNDNRGVNVDPEEEPGNQLAGVDVRWRLPGEVPLAVYAQWIGEDTRRGGPEIGSWLRQAGIEHWGAVGALQHRTHLEITETSCRTGGLGFSEVNPNCGYGHSIYQTGYRYNGRSLAHGMDGDGLSYSIGSTLVQSAGQSWNVAIRHMEINRAGPPDPRHTLSETPQDVTDLHLSYSRDTDIGSFHLGVGGSRTDGALSGDTDTEFSGYLQWSSK